MFHGFLKACKSGTYGEQCNNICGHCRDGGISHHNNGSCLNGCLGDFCKADKCHKQVFKYLGLGF